MPLPDPPEGYEWAELPSGVVALLVAKPVEPPPPELEPEPEPEPAPEPEPEPTHEPPTVPAEAATWLYKSIKDADLGATGQLNQDVTPIIQKWVNSVPAGARGVLVFPKGQYQIGGRVNLDKFDGNFSVAFMGEGDASHLQASFAGWMFDREINNTSPGSPGPASALSQWSYLRLTQHHRDGGLVRVNGMYNPLFDAVHFESQGHGIWAALDTYGLDVRRSKLTRVNNWNKDAIGIMAPRNACRIDGVDFVGWGEAIRAQTSITITGGRFEQNGKAIVAGFGPPPPNAPQQGEALPCQLAIVGPAFESNGVAIMGVQLTKAHLASLSIQPQSFAKYDEPYGTETGNGSREGIYVHSCDTLVMEAVTASGLNSQPGIKFNPDHHALHGCTMNACNSFGSPDNWGLPTDRSWLTHFQCNI